MNTIDVAYKYNKHHPFFSLQIFARMKAQQRQKPCTKKKCTCFVDIVYPVYVLFKYIDIITNKKKRNTSPARCLCVCVLPFFSPLHSLYLVFLLSKYVHSVHTSYSSQNWILHLACIAIPKFASVTTEKTMAFINPISSLRTSAQRVLLFSFDQAFFFPLLLLPSQYSVCI